MDSIETAYNHIVDLHNQGHSYLGYGVYPVSKDDLLTLKSIADKYGFPFEWLINLINFESAGTFNPAIQNSIGATGLIQFMKSTAQGLGTSTDVLSKMNFKQQLTYVDKYLYDNLRSHLNSDGKVPSNFTEGDLFMTIFYPAAIGKPDFIFPSNVQKANAGITKPHDYADKALKVAIFPLSIIPYELSQIKKAVAATKQVISDTKEFTKKHWLPITLISAGALGMIIFMIVLARKNKTTKIA